MGVRMIVTKFENKRSLLYIIGNVFAFVAVVAKLPIIFQVGFRPLS